ncbi:hypothetical protein GLAREA_09727 [Glarea lozoyensis ATCC 20868]|uniref:Heterokaryon incompatibility domain-containing protein n=1 Tax=Glarea lozoyensis (strain ATCC 20868 / MF5171) TaxID=1116229 RepID=S3D9D3_GLAL2|nr:uncharacterized protein GLAREA_09727 [Glarea lozoyensis ATCC 20868]EPE28606.1 hypothetical protein GLAREA_09727 [Glarea lozoyensis ATCC 20868]
MPSLGTDKIFNYRPLIEKDAIRLILLEPSPRDSPICCSIEHSTLTRFEHELRDHYTALSYVWGSPTKTHEISVDGCVFGVTSNLESALRHLREEEPGRVLRLWVDAICIDQENEGEKNTQVQQMGRIYATAHHTVIYLGESTEATDWAFEKLRSWRKERGKSASETDAGDVKSGVDNVQKLWDILESDVLTCQWFSRAWVFQELMRSGDPWLQCGNMRTRWDKFCEATRSVWEQLAHREHKELWPIMPRPEGLDLLQKMQTRRQRLLYPQAALLPLADDHNYRYIGPAVNKQRDKTKNNLLDLLSLRRNSHASVSKDKIFALLGIASDYRKDPGDLRVDYGLSTVQVFTKAAQYIVLHSKEHFDAFLDEVLEGDLTKRTRNLPSWVPDWNLDRSDNKAPVTWASCCGSLYQTLVPSFRPCEQLPARLVCSGWLFGTVSGLSDKFSYLSKSEDQLREAWRDVVNRAQDFHAPHVIRDGYWGIHQLVDALFATLYNDWLGHMKTELQDHLIPIGSERHLGDDYSHGFRKIILDLVNMKPDGDVWYERTKLHPMAIMCCLCMGHSFNLKDVLDPKVYRREKSEEEMMNFLNESCRFVDGQRMGLLNFESQIITIMEKQKAQPKINGQKTYQGPPPYKLDIGLLPNSAQNGDIVCSLFGSERLLVCRAVPKGDVESNEIGQHLTMVGECYPNDASLSCFNGKDVPVTNFIIH